MNYSLRLAIPLKIRKQNFVHPTINSNINFDHPSETTRPVLDGY